MANETKNVTAAKPSVGGAVYVAPLGTTLPTDATTALNAAFKSLGYCSDDGLTNANSPETDNQAAWGGTVVLTLQTSKEDTFGFKLIESLNVDVLKTVYGTDNVSGTLDEGIKISATNDDPEEFSWVFEMILKDSVLKRIVVPCAAITEIGEISYKDNEAIGYECTITATPVVEDEKSKTHDEYIIKKKSQSTVNTQEG